MGLPRREHSNIGYADGILDCTGDKSYDVNGFDSIMAWVEMIFHYQYCRTARNLSYYLLKVVKVP